MEKLNKLEIKKVKLALSLQPPQDQTLRDLQRARL